LLSVKMNYTIELSIEDFRVIMAALKSGGENLELAEKSREPAKALQDHLFKERNRQVSLMLRNLDKMSDHEVEAT